jgi:phosphopantetheinyl transferase
MDKNLAKQAAPELPTHLTKAPMVLKVLEFYSKEAQEKPLLARVVVAASQLQGSGLECQRQACQFLLQRMLACAPSRAGSRWGLSHSQAGAPFLVRDGLRSDLTVSMSHSANWLVVGIAERARIGVDIERARQRANAEKVANFLGWDTQIGRGSDFYPKWVLWEASAKCIGGSALMPHNPGFERLCHLDTNQRLGASGAWSGTHGRIGGEAFYAVVLHGQSSVPLSLRQLDPQAAGL